MKRICFAGLRHNKTAAKPPHTPAARRLSAALAGVLAAFLLPVMLLAQSLSVFAYTPVDQAKQGTLTVTMSGGAGFAFRIYKIADFTSAGADFVLTAKVKELNADLPEDRKIDPGSGKWDAYAVTLENYAPRLPEAQNNPAVTDAEGKAVFTGLKPGVYLVLGTSREVNGKKYTFSPILVSVPSVGQKADGTANDAWDYEVKAQAKYSTETVPTGGKQHRYSVAKYWQNDQGTGRPKSIDVTVYRRDLQSGVSDSYGDWHVSGTYTLSDSNNWSAGWTGDGKSEYRVLENATVRNVDGAEYKVSITSSTGKDNDGAAHTWFTLTNRKATTPPPDQTRHDDKNGTSDHSSITRSSSSTTITTGDDARMNLWFVVCVASGAVLVLWGVLGFKKK